MMLTHQFSKDSPISTHLENTFNLYDKDNNGKIGQQDLIRVSKELDEGFSNEDAATLINMAKAIVAEKNPIDFKEEDDGGGEVGINREEFVSLLMRVNFIRETRETEEDGKLDRKQYNNSASVKTGNYTHNNSLSRQGDSVNNKSRVSNVSNEK